MMEYSVIKLSENQKLDYDRKVNSPNQLRCFAKVSGMYDSYYYFLFSNDVLLFRLEKVGFLIKAVSDYPNENKKLLNAFMSYCNSNNYIYSLVLENNILDKYYFNKSIINKIDFNNFKLVQKLRYEVNKAKKAGIKIKLLNSVDDLDMFSLLHSITVKRGNSNTKISLKEKLINYKKELNKKIFYFGAFDNNKLVGGVILLLNKGNLLYLHNATDPDYYRVNPTYLLLNGIIEWSKKKGYNFLNMNIGLGSYLNNKGSKRYNIEKFKTKWGTSNKLYIYEPLYWIIYKKIFIIYKKIKSLIN